MRDPSISMTSQLVACVLGDKPILADCATDIKTHGRECGESNRNVADKRGVSWVETLRCLTHKNRRLSIVSNISNGT